MSRNAAEAGDAMDELREYYLGELDKKDAEIERLYGDIDKSQCENERLRRELAEERRLKPELEAQATVRGYNDGIAEMKRRLGALNIRLGDDQQHRVGEYIADYTMPSQAEINAPDKELDELLANSRLGEQKEPR